ncbi:hypothetical protein ILYODFUR_029958 [Ilyodon furcidens]|uniref:Uncharacterized protein n=1 Tax=Ilyodon furcidens TaxID=33524 RepID=A0ABV0T2H7_9TELE
MHRSWSSSFKCSAASNEFSFSIGPQVHISIQFPIISEKLPCYNKNSFFHSVMLPPSLWGCFVLFFSQGCAVLGICYLTRGSSSMFAAITARLVANCRWDFFMAFFKK